VLEGHELLTENLAIIERATGFAAHRHRLAPADDESSKAS